MVRVALLCNDSLGERMAGPAIRYWELAGRLAERHDVRLVTFDASTRPSETFDVRSVTESSLEVLLRDRDVCITQLVWPAVAVAARRHGVRLVLDSYDPILLEDLEAHAFASTRSQRVRNRRTLAKVRVAVAAADALICANDRQRDLWLGFLMAMDRLTPAAYDHDRTFAGLVNLVPFGVPDVPPVRSGPGIRAQIGLGEDDVLLLWGGGIWNWFDPLTLLDAVAVLVPRHPNLHLAFLGVRHPNSRVPAAEMAGRMIARAEELGLLGSHVHVNHEWTPYDERQNHLLDADIGVSTHFDQLETRFAFRTRLLDYLWAGLPIVTTEGDSMAEVVDRERLGRCVPPEDVPALVVALEDLITDVSARRAAGRRSSEVAKRYRWSLVAEELEASMAYAMEHPRAIRLPVKQLLSYTDATVRQTVVDKRLKEVASKLGRRVARRRR